jgi:hypothetical protein
MNKEDFNTFRPFIYAAIIAWAVFARKKYKIMSESKEGHSKSSIKYLFSNDMPNRYLSKILNINQSSIARYKKEAEKGKYISIKHKNVNTGLLVSHLPLIQKYADERTKNSIYIINGIIHIRDADIIKPLLKLAYLKHLRKPP